MLGGEFFQIKREFADIRPPFSSTVHKSQGSTFETVFIDFGDLMRCRDTDVRRQAYLHGNNPRLQACAYQWRALIMKDHNKYITVITTREPCGKSAELDAAGNIQFKSNGDVIEGHSAGC